MAAWWKKNDYDNSKGYARSSKSDKNPMSWSYQDREDDDKKTSAWKDWHRDDSGDEMRSPQGNRKQVLDSLSDFKPNSQCLDNREVFGRKFYNIYKRIQLTSWSQKDGLAGREISDLKWFELAYGVGITFIFAIFLPEPLRQLCSAVRPMNQYWLPAFCQQFDSQNDIGTLTVCASCVWGAWECLRCVWGAWEFRVCFLLLGR